MKQTLAVAAIENGSVIDHIPAGFALLIIKLLKLDEHRSRVTLGLNLPSNRLGFKDIIKIEGRFLTPKDIHEIAIFAPEASINFIHHFELTEKSVATLPKHIRGILSCPNKTCISQEPNVKSQFTTEEWQGDIHLICHYCEQQFLRKEII